MNDYGFVVIDDNGETLSSSDVFFSMIEDTVLISPRSTVTIRSVIHDERVAYAVSPINGLFHTFSMQLNQDNSLTVRNTTSYEVSIDILRY
ncbi:MAG: hypothetical protein ACRCZ3_10690 [Providencia rustigianii]|uniref:hypothetical protein n=1 Tax=Providencia rustigianii TaxID=158850 RepID=UPI003F2D8D36